MAEGAKALAAQVLAGERGIDDITEESLGLETCLADLPDVDLLIRTGAEQRVSNFLLWQISYAELFFADCLWPDFDQRWFEKAVTDYYQRQRRFGSNPEPLIFESAEPKKDASKC